MPIPESIRKKGYMTAEELTAQRGIMIAVQGPSDSGKSEFFLSAPDPMGVIAIDRMVDGTLRNEDPPTTRRPMNNVAFKIIKVPLAGTGKRFLGKEEVKGLPDDKTSKNQDIYKLYWEKFRDNLYEALEEPWFRTVVVDGDSDSWQLQRLAAFGKLDKIMPINYTEVNSARKAMIAKCWDSGKIIICTNKVKEAYEDKVDSTGKVEKDNLGNNVQVKSGEDVSEGFHDRKSEYMWHIRLEHIYEPAVTEDTVIAAGPRKGQVIVNTITPARWGIKIIKCKSRKTIEGLTLWGPDCSFSGLMRVAYPNTPLSFWGI